MFENDQYNNKKNYINNENQYDILKAQSNKKVNQNDENKIKKK